MRGKLPISSFQLRQPDTKIGLPENSLVERFIGKVQKPFNRNGNKKMFKSSMNLRMAILVCSYLTAFYKSAGKTKCTSLFGWCLIYLELKFPFCVKMNNGFILTLTLKQRKTNLDLETGRNKHCWHVIEVCRQFKVQRKIA